MLNSLMYEERVISAKNSDLLPLDKALHDAIESRNLKEVHALLKQGADIYARNVSGETSLHAAAAAQSPLILILLTSQAVQQGERAKIQHSLEQVDAQGYTPLHRLIQSVGSDYDYSSFSNPAELSNMLELMLNLAPGSVHTPNGQGDTPLHSAVLAARDSSPYNRPFPSKLAGILLQRGARTDKTNSLHETTLDLLVGVKYEEKPEFKKIARLCIESAVHRSQPQPAGIQDGNWLNNLWTEIETEIAVPGTEETKTQQRKVNPSERVDVLLQHEVDTRNTNQLQLLEKISRRLCIEPAVRPSQPRTRDSQDESWLNNPRTEIETGIEEQSSLGLPTQSEIQTTSNSLSEVRVIREDILSEERLSASRTKEIKAQRKRVQWSETTMQHQYHSDGYLEFTPRPSPKRILKGILKADVHRHSGTFFGDPFLGEKSSGEKIGEEIALKERNFLR